MPVKIITIPSDKLLGMHLRAETFIRDGFYFDFPTFEKGYEYPIVANIDKNSQAYKQGIRIGNKIISLNNYTLYCKDISTVKSDFDYEKRCNTHLILKIKT
tara:strand:- start:148 stop:450 length:303 start_codon:yes stop_codon:yes gene_type:complete